MRGAAALIRHDQSGATVSAIAPAALAMGVQVSAVAIVMIAGTLVTGELIHAPRDMLGGP